MTNLNGTKRAANAVAAVCIGCAAYLGAAAQEPPRFERPITRPIAPTCEQIDDYFGTKIADPYRWMETEKTPELEKWIAEENAATQDYLA